APTPSQRRDSLDHGLSSGRSRRRCAHRDSPHVFWSNSRPESGPEPVRRVRLFFNAPAACGWARPIVASIQRGGQRTGVRLETLPELAPEPAPFPVAKAVRARVPVSKLLWQITPRCPSAGQG